MKNTYRIYIKSAKHARTINTPMMGRVNYERVNAIGKEEFIRVLNELVKAGEEIREVRYGYGGTYICYWNYIVK